MKLNLLALTIFSLTVQSGYVLAEPGNSTSGGLTNDQSLNKGPGGAQTDDERIREIVSKAFEISKTEQLPLEPEQINQFQKRLDETGEAIFPSSPPKMINRSQRVSLEPGAQPVTVRLAPGYVSSITVVDSTGEPWPITTATVGNASWFSVVKPETGAGNMLTINALKNHVSSNIAITLKGRDAPLLVQLSMNNDGDATKPQEADMLVSMRMNKPGPNAAPPVIGPQLNNSVSSELMSFLDGVSPKGASMVKLKDAPDGVSAWQHNNQLYLRTPYTARWPAWIQEASSSDNMHVYVMPMQTQVILAVNGASIQVGVVQ